MDHINCNAVQLISFEINWSRVDISVEQHPKLKERQENKLDKLVPLNS